MGENEGAQEQEMSCPATEGASEKGEEGLPRAAQAPQKAAPLKERAGFVVPLVIFAAIVIFVIAAVVLFSNPPQKYVFVVDGISYQSNSYVPSEFFDEFKRNKVVYISPKISDGSSQFLTNEMQLWNIVLTAQGIKTILLLRVDVLGSLAFCQTNDGNVLMNKQISLEQCNSILGDSGNAVVAIENGAPASKVLLSENRIDVFSEGNDAFGSVVNFSVIKQMFPDAQEILDKVNIKVAGASASGGASAGEGNAPLGGNASGTSGAPDANAILDGNA